jgi:hypothetical protein
MAKKRYTPEQIIGKLREAEVALAQGQTTGQVCRPWALLSRLIRPSTGGAGSGGLFERRETDNLNSGSLSSGAPERRG